MILFLAWLSTFSQDSTSTFDYNYKRAMEHYNKGVEIVNNIGEDDPVLDVISAQVKEQFQLALPYLLKAHSINSKNEKLLTALQGTYFGLYDFEKSDRYKSELELLNKKK